MKNKLIDLNNHLFMQMERLSQDDLKDEELAREIKRATAVSNLAAQIVNNANLALKAAKAVSDGYIRKPPEMLGIPTDEDI